MDKSLDLAAGEQAAALPGVRQARLVHVRRPRGIAHGGYLRPDRIAQAVRGRRLAARAARRWPDVGTVAAVDSRWPSA